MRLIDKDGWSIVGETIFARKMRDPKRLDDFYSEFRKIHAEYFPDWRFGQLCFNFFGWLHMTKQLDFYFLEEDMMIKYLREYTKACC